MILLFIGLDATAVSLKHKLYFQDSQAYNPEVVDNSFIHYTAQVAVDDINSFNQIHASYRGRNITKVLKSLNRGINIICRNTTNRNVLTCTNKFNNALFQGVK